MGHGSQYKVYIQENELGVELQKATDKSTFFMLFHVPFYSRSYSGGLACGMEFKDRAYGGKWDWLDLLATILGGVLGQMLQILLIYALKCVS